jgi:hypothetical protein
LDGSELAEIRDEMDALIDRSTIRNVRPNTDESLLVFARTLRRRLELLASLR